MTLFTILLLLHHLQYHLASTIFEVLLDFACLVDKSKEQHLQKERAKQRKDSLLASSKNKSQVAIETTKAIGPPSIGMCVFG